MSLSMYAASVPVCVRVLTGLQGVLAKGAAHAEAHKIEPAALLHDRLFPTMFPFTRQVHIATSFATGGCARLAGLEPPALDDTSTDFPGLQARTAASLAFLNGLTPAQIDGSETREIHIKVGGVPHTFDGQTYLLHLFMAHVYFHATTAYDILRHNGVDVGKRDFLGPVPGMA